MTQNSQNGEINPKCNPPGGWGCRHTLVLLGFLGFAISYAMRFNLSLTIVAMVHHAPINASSTNATINTYCLAPNSSAGTNSSSGDDDDKTAEFNWTEAKQGLILGSFFWGYFLTQLPGGIIAQKYGAKWVLGIGLLVAAIFTLLTPIAARMGEIYLIIIRVIEGLGEGVVFPAAQVLLTKWIPMEERSKLATIVYSGVSIGAAVTMLASGFLIDAFGWASVFYVTGAVSVLWFFAWAICITELPIDHPRISAVEKLYIISNIEITDEDNSIRPVEHNNIRRTRPTSRPINNKKKSKSTPWFQIFTSLPVIAICTGQIAFAWGLYTLLTQLPTYLKTVLHFDIKQNSLTSSSPYLCMFIFGTFITHLGDKLIQNKICSIIFCRKLLNTVAQWGTALAFIGAAYSGCNTIVTIICLNLAAGLIGLTFGGCLVSSMDISSNYSGVISGIANSFANICGFSAPYIAGLLISGNPSIEQWRIVFIISAILLFVGNSIFLIFGSAKLQSWNSGDSKSRRNREEVNERSYLVSRRGENNEDDSNSRRVQDEDEEADDPNKFLVSRRSRLTSFTM